MKSKLFIPLALLVFILVSCATQVYVLREMAYFAGELRNVKIGEYPSMCECREAAMSYQIPNDPNALTLGTELFYCEEVKK
jgi:hypothetical protein